MVEDVAAAFLRQGIVGAVALLAIGACLWVYRAAERERERHEKRRDELIERNEATRAALVAQVIEAHKARADDAKTALGTASAAMQEMASAGDETAKALGDVREVLRNL